MKHALIAIGAAVLIALLYWHGTTVELIPELPQASGDAGGAAEPEPLVESVEPDDNKAPPPAAVEHASRTLRMQVVDGGGDPAEGAEVTIHEQRDRRRGLQLWTGLSDAAGRCQAAIRGPVLVSARKAGLGWSGDLFANPESVADLRAVLLPVAVVAGTVLASDGRPLAGVRLRGSCPTAGPERCAELPTARTDADGAFEIEVLAGHEYSFVSELDGQAARDDVPKLRSGQRFELTLQFTN